MISSYGEVSNGYKEISVIWHKEASVRRHDAFEHKGPCEGMVYIYVLKVKYVFSLFS